MAWTPPVADIVVDGVQAMSGGSSCDNQGLAGPDWDYVYGYIIDDPSACIQTFDGHNTTFGVGIQALYPTPVYGFNGNTVPWSIALVAHKPGGGVDVVAAGDWYTMSPACFFTVCPFAIEDVPLLGQYTKYELTVTTSEGPVAFAMAVVPPPLDNWISGPTVLPALQHGTWIYGASGGGTPYTTTWYRKNKWSDSYTKFGTGTTFTSFSSECDGDFWVKAVTTSPNGMSAESVLFVDVVPTPDCRE